MDSAPLRLAVLSFWHVHAGDYARRAVEHTDTELVAVWDADSERGRAGADQFGVDFVEDLDDLLGRDDLDAVIVTTPTRDHVEVMLRAAKAKKHIFTEKLLAPTVAGAEQIVEACHREGVQLIVSLPRLYHGYTVALRELVEADRLGRLSYARVRLSHDGASAGWLPDRFFDPEPSIGGALTDLGCHPVYLTQLFLGARPTSVSATYGAVTGKRVEDNAVVTLGYDDGSIGVVEAGFAARTPFSIELAGTEGWLRYADDEHRLVAGGTAFGDRPVNLEIPDDAQDAFGQWVEAIRAAGSDAEASLEVNQAAAVELTRLVVAANRSASEGRAVAL